MNNLEKLRDLRTKYRNHFFKKKLGYPSDLGLVIKIRQEKVKRLHDELVNFFIEEGFNMINHEAKSPSGKNNQNFTVNISALVSQDYHIPCGFSISISHDEEWKIPFAERAQFYY